MTATAIPPFERFYAEHSDEVFATSRAGRAASCDDAFQETFLRALRGYDKLGHGEHLRAWVFTIATRVAIDPCGGGEAQSSSSAEPVVARAGPRYARARAPRRRAAGDGARCRGPPLRLRPRLRRHRRGARLERGGGAPGRVLRRPPFEEESSA